MSALQPLIADATAAVNKGISKLADNIQNLLKKYNSFIDKLEYYLNHPDVIVSKALSKIFKKNISFRDEAVEKFRQQFAKVNLQDLKVNDDEKNSKTSYSTKSNNSNEHGYISDAGQAVIDLILLLFVYDEVSLEMTDIFGEDFTSSFFTLLNLTSTIIPSVHNVILGFIKDVPTDIWEAIESNVKGNISVENLTLFFSTSFVNAILNYAEASFLQLFSVWGSGYYSLELIVLAVGIINDDSLTPIEKFTLFFVDAISILLSNIISIASNAFDFSGPLKVIVTIASVLIPIATDIIGKVLIKRR